MLESAVMRAPVLSYRIYVLKDMEYRSISNRKYQTSNAFLISSIPKGMGFRLNKSAPAPSVMIVRERL
jgi:hypothetical protein